jgi:hypothetical protein
MGIMKTTIEIPDLLFRRAKSHAAERGQTLKDFVTDALKSRLETEAEADHSRDPKWMAGFGALARLRKETARIQAAIDETFEVVEDEDRS